MICENCMHKAVCYRVDSVKNDYAQKCGDFVSDCKALEQEPSNEMVSRGVFEQVMWERNVAINQLKELGYGLGEKPKTGHWRRELIRNEKGGCIGAKMICSECDNDNKHDEYMSHCPNCGAKMEVEE